MHGTWTDSSEHRIAVRRSEGKIDVEEAHVDDMIILKWILKVGDWIHLTQERGLLAGSFRHGNEHWVL
jgi:hypothetical protein